MRYGSTWLRSLLCYIQNFVIEEFVISGQFPMRYCSTWLRSLLCYIEKFVIHVEEFVKSVPLYIRTYVRMYIHIITIICV